MDSKHVKVRAITFDKETKVDVLDMMGISTDKMGFLIFKNDERYLKTDGLPVHIDEFAGLYKGKNGELIVAKNDIGSLIELSDNLKPSVSPDLRRAECCANCVHIWHRKSSELCKQHLLNENGKTRHLNTQLTDVCNDFIMEQN